LFRQRALDVIQTWGRKCDKIYAFSDEKWTLPGDLHVTTIALDLGEDNDWAHLWQKTGMIMKSLAEDFWERDKLDFVAMADDDSFYIMENLRSVLGSHKIQANAASGKPVLLGGIWEKRGNPAGMNVWVSGGGYVFNRVVAEEASKCAQSIKKWAQIPEDVMVCACLHDSRWGFNVYNESEVCDSRGRNLFSQSSALDHWGSNRAGMSPSIIQFHRSTGDDRYHFFHSLYGDHSIRLCADDPGPVDMERLRLTIDRMVDDRGYIHDAFDKTMSHDLGNIRNFMVERDRELLGGSPVPCSKPSL
jgi:hypothetical protein